GKACRPGTGAKVGDTTGKIIGYGAGKHHGVDPRPVPLQRGLEQVEPAAMECIQRMGRIGRWHGSAAQLAFEAGVFEQPPDFVLPVGIDQHPA
ncbi:hypothetical protein NL321_27860, partial [Klebsiella pneumoniae]|nr:hypothetical protein [Klebsiella pneumoniae]